MTYTQTLPTRKQIAIAVSNSFISLSMYLECKEEIFYNKGEYPQ